MSFLHAFFQAASRAGIQIHQFAMQLIERTFGLGVAESGPQLIDKRRKLQRM